MNIIIAPDFSSIFFKIDSLNTQFTKNYGIFVDMGCASLDEAVIFLRHNKHIIATEDKTIYMNCGKFTYDKVEATTFSEKFHNLFTRGGVFCNESLYNPIITIKKCIGVDELYVSISYNTNRSINISSSTGFINIETTKTLNYRVKYSEDLKKLFSFVFQNSSQ